MKDKGFSYSNKVQRYHGEGRESIIVMGKPFRVLENLSAPNKEMRRRMSHDSRVSSMVFLVRNSTNLSCFPRTFALKRSIFQIDQVHEAHHEIEMLSRLSNKNIVKSYHCEVSRHEGQLGVSICTEYCGNNLWRRIKSGMGSSTGSRMFEGEIACVLIGAANALGYLHAQQPPIAYRNIHPKNILLSSRCTGPEMYKLCNFSMATTEAFQCANRDEAERVMRDMDHLNTLSFVAPEMAGPMKGNRIDEQVDMWALGVLLYSMMFMKLPFEASLSTLAKTPHYVIPANSPFSGSFQTILSHLLDPNPRTRWNVFALINFLRFDEDIGRHLGTFFFTYTEYPDGWEGQEVFTVGRPKPPKNPAIRYQEGAPVAHVGQVTTEDNESDDTRSRPETHLDNTSGSSASIPADDPGFLRALKVLESTGDIDDPRIAAYRKAILEHQNAMWEKATKRRSVSDPPPPKGSEPPRHDDLEDLFGPPETTAPCASAHVDPFRSMSGGGTAPLPPIPGGVVPAAAAPAPVDIFDANALFASPATGVPAVQQGVPPVWAADPPGGSPGPAGVNFSQQMPSAAPMMGNAAGGGGAVGTEYSPFAPTYPPAHAAPPVMNFLDPPPGVNTLQQPQGFPAPGGMQNPTTGVTSSASAKPKDPFSDLFSNA